MLEYIIKLDQFLIQRMSEIHSQYADMLMIFLTKLGNYGFLWIVLAIFLFFYKKYRAIAVTCMTGLAIDLVLGEGILKHIFQRQRPFQELSDIGLLIPEPMTSSFPSGHTSAAWCFAIIFAYFFYKKFKGAVIYVWILAVGVTISRLYLQVHYPSDILAGIFVGIISAVIAILIYAHTSKFLITK